MFDNQFVTTKCILKKDWKILLLQEAISQWDVDNFHTGKYGLPWGRLDPGERLLDGVRREMMEEVWREVQVGNILHCSDFVIDYKKESRHGILLVFDAKFGDKKEIVLSEEHSSYWWFALEDLNDIHMIPNQIQLIKDLLS